MSKITIFKNGEKVYQGEGTITPTPLNVEKTETDTEFLREFAASWDIVASRKLRRFYRKQCKRRWMFNRESRLLSENIKDCMKMIRCYRYDDSIPRKLRRNYPYVSGLLRTNFLVGRVILLYAVERWRRNKNTDLQ